MHVGIADTWWRGKRFRHSRRMRSPQFYVSGKRSIVWHVALEMSHSHFHFIIWNLNVNSSVLVNAKWYLTTDLEPFCYNLFDIIVAEGRYVHKTVFGQVLLFKWNRKKSQWHFTHLCTQRITAIIQDTDIEFMQRKWIRENALYIKVSYNHDEIAKYLSNNNWTAECVIFTHWDSLRKSQKWNGC